MKQDELLKIIRSPHLSEKASLSAQKGEYVFEVASNATKLTIKTAVESLFDKVKVKSVRIVNVKTKPKRFGKILGRSKAWKKAYVSLLEGQIELMGDSQ